ncbi:MAG: amidase [Solirubrobacteraceae bacterium]
MTLTPPTRDELAAYAERAGMMISAEDLDDCVAWAARSVIAMGRVAQLGNSSRRPHTPAERDAGRRPTPSEDPYNAIVRFCEAKGSGDGPLAGMRIGVKDNIAVAGVPMTRGDRIEGAPVPREDAAVIERLLDAGASVTAKTNTAWQLAGAALGDTLNPRDPRFSPGFSSSGSAAAVATRLVDAALGTDIAGSVRIPAAWCGIVGMKATHGLVPTSSGLRAHALNDIGPLTMTVAESEALLEVMTDGERVTAGAAGAEGIAALRIGVVPEAAEPGVCTPGTLSAFDRAREILAGSGATVTQVSVPLWRHAATILLATQDLWQMASESHWLREDADYLGRIDEALLSELANDRDAGRQRPVLVTAEYLRERAEGAFVFAQAHNLRLELRRQLEQALSQVDVLVTPTTVAGPFRLDDQRLADPDATRALLELMIRNTAPLNLTGHPALSIPSGPGDDDLPTGLQIVGRRFADSVVYRVGIWFDEHRDAGGGCR